jgi:hypothetical protein
MGLFQPLVLLPILSKVVIGILFVFQNSYAHLIYTQQWSFLGSVMTPTEGTKWFSAVAGISSMVCTVTATLVHTLADQVGLLGLLFGTCITLFGSMVLADEAYRLSEVYGFDPTPDIHKRGSSIGTTSSSLSSSKDNTTSAAAAAAITSTSTAAINNNNRDEPDHNDKINTDETSQTSIPTPVLDRDSNNNNHREKNEESLLSKTKRLFRTSPLLGGLFVEVITFQSLSTVLNVCFVKQLKLALPIDTDRASYTGQFYALVNGSSGLLQFLVLPLARQYLEPQWVYKFLPGLLMPLLLYTAIVVSSIPSMVGTTTMVSATTAAAAVVSTSVAHAKGLRIAAVAFFALKSLDYSIRNVANEMVYQPLDFDARYLGKEVIGVFANRLGKSGSSMMVSALTSIFPRTWGGGGTLALAQLSVGVGTLWTMCSVWLSSHVVTNKQAEERVQERRRRMTPRSDASNSDRIGDDDNSKAAAQETKKTN